MRYFVNSSLAPVVLFRRRLKSVADVLKKNIRSKGFTQSRWDALLGYGEAVCRHGPCCPISSLRPWDKWIHPDLHGFYKWVFDAMDLLNDFAKQVVVCRRDSGIRTRCRYLGFLVWLLSWTWLRPLVSGQCILDAYIAMIPKADVDSTPLGQRRLSVLPVVYRLWASLRLGHLREWVEGWLPKSVFSLGNGLSSVEAWFSTALDTEEVFSLVLISCTFWLLMSLSPLILLIGPFWIVLWGGWDFLTGFVRFIFLFMVRFVSGLSLQLVLVNLSVETVVFPQGSPLSMVFTVALYVPWCRHLESLPDVKPQPYADNLKCSAQCPDALFGAARFTAQYVRSVGQDVSPGKCVLLSTSKSARKSMKLWDISGDVSFWKVMLAVRDLGGHLDFARRARAGRVKEATAGVATVGALPFGFS